MCLLGVGDYAGREGDAELGGEGTSRGAGAPRSPGALGEWPRRAHHGRAWAPGVRGPQPALTRDLRLGHVAQAEALGAVYLADFAAAPALAGRVSAGAGGQRGSRAQQPPASGPELHGGAAAPPAARRASLGSRRARAAPAREGQSQGPGARLAVRRRRQQKRRGQQKPAAAAQGALGARSGGSVGRPKAQPASEQSRPGPSAAGEGVQGRGVQDEAGRGQGPPGAPPLPGDWGTAGSRGSVHFLREAVAAGESAGRVWGPRGRALHAQRPGRRHHLWGRGGVGALRQGFPRRT